MVRAMGHPWFGSKAASGLWQALIALMPPHAVYIETHLGGGAVMKRKPAALRNIGIDRDARALSSFECGHAVELVNADCHGYLADFAFDGSELVYSDPPYLRGARKSGRRYRHDYEDADHAALLGLLKGLPCAVMVSGYPSALYDELLRGWRSVSLQVMNQAGGGHREGLVQLRAGPCPLGALRGTRLHASPDGQAQGAKLGPALPGDAAGGAPGGAGRDHGGGGAGGAVKHLARHLGRLGACFARLPDPRRGRNRRYAMRDIAMAALSVFFMQSPSFLAHQRALAERHARSNAHTLFGLARIPCDNHIRQLLDGVPPAHFDEQFHAIAGDLDAHGALAPMRRLDGRVLVALDGTEFFRSRKLHCPNCSTRKRNDGATEYFHQMLAATLVAPGQARTLPLPPMFVRPQDGVRKQDCERL